MPEGSLRTLVFEGLLTDDLRDQFRALGTEPAGFLSENPTPKYHEGTIRKLAKLIVFRLYGKIVTKAVLFARVCCFASAQESRVRLPHIFIAAPYVARSRVFRERLTAAATILEDAGFIAGPEGLVIKVGVTTHTLHYGEMALLAALLNFSFLSLDNAELDAALAPANNENLTPDALRRAERAFSSMLYAYTNDHCRPVQEIKKYKRLVDYLPMAQALDRQSSIAGDETFDDGPLTALNDETALEFWLDALQNPEDTGFRKLDSIFEGIDGFVALIESGSEKQALERGLTNYFSARPSDSNGEGDIEAFDRLTRRSYHHDFDGDGFDGVVDQCDLTDLTAEWGSEFAPEFDGIGTGASAACLILEEPLLSIKYFKAAKKYAVLRKIIQKQAMILRFPLLYLRMRSFAELQIS